MICPTIADQELSDMQMQDTLLEIGISNIMSPANNNVQFWSLGCFHN